MKKVGIPHALFYYYYYPLWKTFFSDLGAQVIKSAHTNPLIIEQGVKLAVDEACFPVKVYYGHVKELAGKELDYIFIPRVVSIEPRSYICPKFMGLPDMIKAGIGGLPEIIDMPIDLSKNDYKLQKDIVRVGKLFTCDQKVIKKAYQHGMQEMYMCKSLARQGYTLEEAIRLWEGEVLETLAEGDLRIGVLGHGYSIYDDCMSMSLINRLRAMGARVYLPECLPREEVEREARSMPKRIFWTMGRKLVGCALHMEKRPDIDGVIYVSCFGCGPDSMIGEIIERKLSSKPFMLITIDEHTAEGGLVTRLEAFCDMLRRRRLVSNESNLPAHG